MTSKQFQFSFWRRVAFVSCRVQKVQAQVDETRDIMARNIDSMLDNQEKASILEDKTDNLAQSSNQFKRNATSLKRAMWWKNMKVCIPYFFQNSKTRIHVCNFVTQLWLMIGGAVALIIVVIILVTVSKSKKD